MLKLPALASPAPGASAPAPRAPAGGAPVTGALQRFTARGGRSQLRPSEREAAGRLGRLAHAGVGAQATAPGSRAEEPRPRDEAPGRRGRLAHARAQAHAPGPGSLAQQPGPGPAPPGRPHRPLGSRLPTRAAGLAAVVVLVTLAAALPAHAGTGGGQTFLINQMLDRVLDWLSGPLATTLGTIALVAAAFVWMFLRHERGADFAFRALLGTALAVGAANLLGFMVGSGGVV